MALNHSRIMITLLFLSSPFKVLQRIFPLNKTMPSVILAVPFIPRYPQIVRLGSVQMNGTAQLIYESINSEITFRFYPVNSVKVIHACAWQ